MPMARVCTACGASVENAPLRRICSICDKEMTDGYQLPRADALIDNKGQNVGGTQIDVCPLCYRDRQADVVTEVFGSAKDELAKAETK